MNNMTSIEEIFKYQQELLTQQEDQKTLQKETFKLLDQLNKNLTFMSDRLDEFASKLNIKLDDTTTTTIGLHHQQQNNIGGSIIVPNNIFVTNMANQMSSSSVASSSSASTSSNSSSLSILNGNGGGTTQSTDSNQNYFTQTSNQHLTESINVIDITNLLANAAATVTPHTTNTAVAVSTPNNSNQHQINVITSNQNTVGPLTPNKNSISVLTKIEASSPILTPLTTITTNTLNANTFNSRGNFLLSNNDSSNSLLLHHHQQQQQQQQHHTNQLQLLQQLHYPIKNPTKTQKVKEYFLSNVSNDSNGDSCLLERQRSQNQQQQQQNISSYMVATTNTNGVLKHNNFINNTYTHVSTITNNPNKSPNKSNNISSLINSLEYSNSNNTTNNHQHSQNQLQQMQQNQNMLFHEQQKVVHPSPTSKLLDATNTNSNGNKISTSDESIDDLSNYEESSDEEKETIQFKKKPKLSNDSSPSNNSSQTTKPKDEESHNQQRLFNKYVRESVESRLGKDFLLLHEIQEIDQEVMEHIKKDALQQYPPINIRPRRAWHLAKASLRCRRRSLRRQKEKQITSTGNSTETLPQASSTLTRGAVAAISAVAESVAASLSADASSTLN